MSAAAPAEPCDRGGPQPSPDWRIHADNAAASLALNEPHAARQDLAAAIQRLPDGPRRDERKAALELAADALADGYLTAAMRHTLAALA